MPAAAASPFARFKNWLNAVDDVDGYPIDSIGEVPNSSFTDPSSTPPRRQRGNLTLQRTAEGGMEIRHPQTLEDRKSIGTDLKLRRMVTLDLTRLPDGEARYFLEFVYGVVFALDATAEKVNEGIYLLAPRGISVRNDTEDEPEKPLTSSHQSGMGRGEQSETYWLGR